MRSLPAKILFAFIAEANAKDNAIVDLVGSLFNRAPTVFTQHHADLDNATLGKPWNLARSSCMSMTSLHLVPSAFHVPYSPFSHAATKMLPIQHHGGSPSHWAGCRLQFKKEAMSSHSTQVMLSSTTRPFALNMRLSIRPDQRDAFLRVVNEDQRATMSKETGALQFVVGEDVYTRNTFYLHQEYASKEAFDAHRATPHFAAWDQFCKSSPWSEGGEPVIDFFLGEHEPQRNSVAQPAFCLNVDLFVKPEMKEEFLKVIANNKKGSDEKEPQCLQYVYGESTEAPNTFHFHEEYTGLNGGKAGFEAHRAAPHFAVWEKFAGNDPSPFSKPPVVNFFRSFS
eukprot:gnl/MRDRNA2_/MRDRNA2_115581_c0_seq1.p1 gnl/MRDRNA2_/MRDRNA2_115581_c0~~gnl/MRDRNA2_/MRDRNA2_115581_c0_seq1.p1  ORF type:complete len:340 (-),score=55.73 gnl/MRDRNA2_/MRDRNA2_115581_c0_seq1:27-1046(-)